MTRLHGRRLRLRPAPADLGAGSAQLRALQRPVRVSAHASPDMYALGSDPSPRRGGTLDAITHDAVTVTSQYEDFHRLVRSALQISQCKIRAPARQARPCDLVRYARAAPPRVSSNPQWTIAPVALELDPDASFRLDERSRGGALRDTPGGGARWDKRSPLDARWHRAGPLGHGNGRIDSCRCLVHMVPQRQRAMPKVLRDLRHRHQAYTIMAQVGRRHAGPAAEQHQHQARQTEPSPQSPVEGGSWIATSVSNGIVRRQCDPRRVLRLKPEFAPRLRPTEVIYRRGASW